MLYILYYYKKTVAQFRTADIYKILFKYIVICLFTNENCDSISVAIVNIIAGVDNSYSFHIKNTNSKWHQKWNLDSRCNKKNLKNICYIKIPTLVIVLKYYFTSNNWQNWSVVRWLLTTWRTFMKIITSCNK